MFNFPVLYFVLTLHTPVLFTILKLDNYNLYVLIKFSLIFYCSGVSEWAQKIFNKGYIIERNRHKITNHISYQKFVEFHSVWVSTDHSRIADVAEKSGAKVHRRKSYTATDEAPSILAVQEFIENHNGITDNISFSYYFSYQ